jgi:hypothetical protein
VSDEDRSAWNGHGRQRDRVETGQIQNTLPGAKVVKTLNTINSELMVNPHKLPASHTLFLSGNDAGAKMKVRELLQAFGWADAVDLGDIATARATEAYSCRLDNGTRTDLPSSRSYECRRSEAASLIRPRLRSEGDEVPAVATDATPFAHFWRPLSS